MLIINTMRWYHAIWIVLNKIATRWTRRKCHLNTNVKDTFKITSLQNTVFVLFCIRSPFVGTSWSWVFRVLLWIAMLIVYCKLQQFTFLTGVQIIHIANCNTHRFDYLSTFPTESLITTSHKKFSKHLKKPIALSW
jgi:hypothetical protein